MVVCENRMASLQLTTEVQYVKGIGPRTAQTLAEKGVATVEDLLYYLAIFDAGAPRADVDDGSHNGIPDGGVGIEDLLYYLARFDAGC